MKQFSEVIKLLEEANFYYIICTNMQGNYSYINTNYAERFKHVDENFTGKPFHITMHPDDVPLVMAAGYKCLENRDMLVPALIRKHDGHGGYVVTQWEMKAIIGENGEPEGVFCLGYDITDFITRLNKKNDLLDNIAFNQSHGVRRPLANILGAAELLKHYDLPAEAREMLNILLENTMQLDTEIRKMTNDIYLS